MIYIYYAVAVVLIAASFYDMARGRIPNWLALILPVLFLIAVLGVTAEGWLWQVLYAVAVFVLGFGLFLTGGFGAGAVKLMTGTALFLPPSDWLWHLGILFAGTILSLIVFGLARSFIGREDHGWTVLSKRVIPMAVPVAITGIAGLFLI